MFNRAAGRACAGRTAPFHRCVYGGHAGHSPRERATLQFTLESTLAQDPAKSVGSGWNTREHGAVLQSMCDRAAAACRWIEHRGDGANRYIPECAPKAEGGCGGCAAHASKCSPRPSGMQGAARSCQSFFRLVTVF